jgi:selenide,water dikinase
MNTQLPKLTIALLGAGHTHSHILRMWGMAPVADAQLVCISDAGQATYSGMLPGTLAGLYPPEAMQIDLVRLCRSVGSVLVRDEVIGLDVDQQALLFRERPPLHFDVLSIGIGSVPDRSMLAGDDDGVLAIKPMQTFLDRFSEAVSGGSKTDPAKLRVVIVGGGVAGVEIALALPGWFRTHHRTSPFEIVLLDGNTQLARGVTMAAARMAQQELSRQAVQVELGDPVKSLGDHRVVLASGRTMDFDLAILATSAAPPPLVGKLNLPLDTHGFLQTSATLQSTSNQPIFAVGDTGTIVGNHGPKAGVYAVRQGPFLWKNIGRLIHGEPLVAYRPQKKFLKLLSLGDRRAIASYQGLGFGLGFKGGWCWKWKDGIDRRFMKKYQSYESSPMTSSSPAKDHRADESESPAERMRCLGCGGKVGGAVLARVLAKLNVTPHPLVTHGLDPPDDVAVIKLPEGDSLAATVDFFAPPIDDMFIAGRIAALNAASDLFAKGAEPVAALAQVTLPPGPEAAQEQLLHELLAGGLHELQEMGAALAGGHTLEGPQTTIGFTMLGRHHGKSIAGKGGLSVGDRLVLTKPLGTGALLASHGEADCPAAWFEPLLETMLQSNREAAQLFGEFSVVAATDVTGFGLAGHLLEMLQASQASAVLNLAAVPLLAGFESTVEQGWQSTLAPANRAVGQFIQSDSSTKQQPAYAALFDPQTAGGLLIGVAASAANKLVAQLHHAGYAGAAVVGEVGLEATMGDGQIVVR